MEHVAEAEGDDHDRDQILLQGELEHHPLHEIADGDSGQHGDGNRHDIGESQP